MDTEIKRHFEQLGGLESVIDTDTDSTFNSIADDIEFYLEKKIDPDILDLLSEYQGQSFASDEAVGVYVEEKIPVLGDSHFLDFGIFMTLAKSDYAIEAILKSNEDLFEKAYFPFAEATPGDFIACKLDNKEIYFISHDFNEDEKFRFKIFDNLKSYCMSLQNENEKNPKADQKKTPQLLNVTYDADFLKKAKEEAQKMKDKKNKK